jgi:2'-5' RNA ligase
LEELREASYDLEPIGIELSSVEIFPHSDVIYVSIGAGHEELRRMHDKLDAGSLAFQEFYPFHPHITLAQKLTPDQVDELSEAARRRWSEYKGSRAFRIETVTFVQDTRRNGWIDLAEMALGRLVMA